jgi:EAL domain-containing protein (putative c-di-GMP-specific phosphodiesterase class I)
MIQLCRELNVEVIVEGIETVEERDVLRDLGCDLMQGFLFARPAPDFVTLSLEPRP